MLSVLHLSSRTPQQLTPPSSLPSRSTPRRVRNSSPAPLRPALQLLSFSSHRRPGTSIHFGHPPPRLIDFNLNHNRAIRSPPRPELSLRRGSSFLDSEQTQPYFGRSNPGLSSPSRSAWLNISPNPSCHTEFFILRSRPLSHLSRSASIRFSPSLSIHRRHLLSPVAKGLSPRILQISQKSLDAQIPSSLKGGLHQKTTPDPQKTPVYRSHQPSNDHPDPYPQTHHLNPEYFSSSKGLHRHLTLDETDPIPIGSNVVISIPDHQIHDPSDHVSQLSGSYSRTHKSLLFTLRIRTIFNTTVQQPKRYSHTPAGVTSPRSLPQIYSSPVISSPPTVPNHTLNQKPALDSLPRKFTGRSILPFAHPAIHSGLEQPPYIGHSPSYPSQSLTFNSASSYQPPTLLPDTPNLRLPYHPKSAPRPQVDNLALISASPRIRYSSPGKRSLYHRRSSNALLTPAILLPSSHLPPIVPNQSIHISSDNQGRPVSCDHPSCQARIQLPEHQSAPTIQPYYQASVPPIKHVSPQSRSLLRHTQEASHPATKLRESSRLIPVLLPIPSPLFALITKDHDRPVLRIPPSHRSTVARRERHAIVPPSSDSSQFLSLQHSSFPPRPPSHLKSAIDHQPRSHAPSASLLTGPDLSISSSPSQSSSIIQRRESIRISYLQQRSGHHGPPSSLAILLGFSNLPEAATHSRHASPNSPSLHEPRLSLLWSHSHVISYSIMPRPSLLLSSISHSRTVHHSLPPSPPHPLHTPRPTPNHPRALLLLIHKSISSPRLGYLIPLLQNSTAVCVPCNIVTRADSQRAEVPTLNKSSPHDIIHPPLFSAPSIILLPPSFPHGLDPSPLLSDPSTPKEATNTLPPLRVRGEITTRPSPHQTVTSASSVPSNLPPRPPHTPHTVQPPARHPLTRNPFKNSTLSLPYLQLPPALHRLRLRFFSTAGRTHVPRAPPHKDTASAPFLSSRTYRLRPPSIHNSLSLHLSIPS
uniref:Uncharacterized protein n=1 Tax=Knipowitschia caucasica TaxID=637954 RepID=A0AAV2KB15_KNICA